MVECPAGKLAGVFMRFTIRDVLWLTVVVAMGVAWWLDHTAAANRFSRRERELVLSLGRGGVIVDGR
jgi:hypothetical protein